MRRLLAMAAVLVAGSVTNAYAVPIVTDGNFNNGLTGWTQNGGGTTPGQHITVITTGGTNSTGFGDNVPNFGTANNAAYFVDDNAHESLLQTVSLVAGTQYTVSFALFATVSGAGNSGPFTLDTSLGGTLLSSLTNSSSVTDVPVNQWTDYTYTFTALTNSNLLDFDFTSGSTPAKDVLLTGVDISAAVPEASTWAMMILGFMGLGFMAYRQKALNFA